MIKYESNCVGCADGCHGCGADKKVPQLYCDKCGSNVETLYKFNDKYELCADCILDQFEMIDVNHVRFENNH